MFAIGSAIGLPDSVLVGGEPATLTQGPRLHAFLQNMLNQISSNQTRSRNHSYPMKKKAKANRRPTSPTASSLPALLLLEMLQSTPRFVRWIGSSPSLRQPRTPSTWTMTHFNGVGHDTASSLPLAASNLCSKNTGSRTSSHMCSRRFTRIIILLLEKVEMGLGAR